MFKLIQYEKGPDSAASVVATKLTYAAAYTMASRLGQLYLVDCYSEEDAMHDEEYEFSAGPEEFDS
jgi:hypothetical protein